MESKTCEEKEGCNVLSVVPLVVEKPISLQVGGGFLMDNVGE